MKRCLVVSGGAGVNYLDSSDVHTVPADFPYYPQVVATCGRCAWERG